MAETTCQKTFSRHDNYNVPAAMMCLSVQIHAASYNQQKVC